MPHTQSRYEGEQGFSDGILILGPDEILATGGASAVTRNAAGDISINQGATLTNFYTINIGKAIQRTGLPDKFLEQFGGSNPSLLADPQGIYGLDSDGNAVAGGNPITVRTNPNRKGWKLKGFKVVYLITGAALLAHTCRVDKVTYANNVAVAVVASLASGANGLQTAIQANPYVTAVAMPAAEQIYRFNDLEELVLEVSAQTQAAGAYRIYRIELQLEFNYN